MGLLRYWLLSALLLAPFKAWSILPPTPQIIRVYAAASLTDSLNELATTYQLQHPQVQIQHSFAGSATLAKQLAKGAPADVFISADIDWMDFVAEKGLLSPASRQNLVGNQLVVIASKKQPILFDSANAANDWPHFKGRLCTGAVESVPVGKYARASLMNLGWWPALQPRLVETEDVRSALAFVARGECARGIVYKTDTALSEDIITLLELPASSHPAIVYPGALLQRHSPAAAEFWAFLRSQAALEVFLRHHFTRPAAALSAKDNL